MSHNTLRKKKEINIDSLQHRNPGYQMQIKGAKNTTQKRKKEKDNITVIRESKNQRIMLLIR